MIRLDIQPYCDLCCDFDPDVTKPVKAYALDSDKAVMQSDTIVQCKHAKRCESIKRYLERQIKTAENV